MSGSGSLLEQIRQTESTLGVTFPGSFVEQMLVRNGGDVTLEEEIWSVCEIGEIVCATEDARRWPNFPPAGVAIASNGFGDRLVLLPGPVRRQVLQETVFMWSHETGELDRVVDKLAELGTNSPGSDYLSR